MATNLPSKPKVGTLQKPSPSFHTYPQKEVLQNSFLQHLLFVFNYPQFVQDFTLIGH